MHPTPEEQLRAAERMITEVANSEVDDGADRSDSNEQLRDAARLLRRLERSWAARLPFLTTDNTRAAELLAELAPQLPEFAAEIAAPTECEPLDEPSAHELNKTFQNLLGRAVHALPDDTAGDGGRNLIANHLRDRLAADPSLNRTPIPRPDRLDEAGADRSTK